MADLFEVELDDGRFVRLGNLIPEKGLMKSWKVYGDTPTTPMIKREHWKPVDMSHFMSPVKNQNGIGSCNAHGTVYLVEACRRLQGLKDVLLSPGYLYGRINGGVDRGSFLEDAMTWMMERGTVPASMVPELDWRSVPSEAAEESKKYRILEVWLCPTFDHIASALQCGFFVSVGIMWSSNDNTDSDGWIPSSVRGRAGGHALARCSLDYRNGQWGAGGPNSWGQWGKNGYCVIPETRFDRDIGGFWACRAVVDEGGVVPTP